MKWHVEFSNRYIYCTRMLTQAFVLKINYRDFLFPSISNFGKLKFFMMKIFMF